MPYRTILVVLDAPALAERTLTAATMLAQKHDAHLIGLHVIPSPAIQPTFGYDMPTEVWESIRARGVEKSEALHAQFDAAISAEASLSSEWRSVQSPYADTSDIILDHARRADLVITAQVDPKNPQDGDAELSGTLILESGRPILTVPYAGRINSIGDVVFVAWNGSREATRAVYDALPMLVNAKEVVIYGVNPDSGDAENPRLEGTELATTLARHGVRTTVSHSAGSSHAVANEILSRLADKGADLLVMGGYGHSRARERLFGGATRDILQSMTTPVLMSH